MSKDNPFIVIIEQVGFDGVPQLPRFCIERSESYNPTDETRYGLCGARWKYAGLCAGDYLQTHQEKGRSICGRCLRKLLSPKQETRE